MPLVSFAEGAAIFDSTPVENMFLMEYMPAAPENCVRVYLYARMAALHPELCGDNAAMARVLRMDEDALLDAFAYWEQRGLARRLTDRPPTYELLPFRAGAPGGPGAMDRTYYEFRDFNADLQALFPNKLIQPRDYARAQEWVKELRFEQAAVLLAVRQEAEASRNARNKGEPDPRKVFEKLDRRMIEWSDRGLLTVADIERETRFDGPVREMAWQLIRRFSMRHEPTIDELLAVQRWMTDWGYGPEEIQEACGETLKAREPNFSYLDKILDTRRQTDDWIYFPELSESLRELDPKNAMPSPDQLKRYGEWRREGFEEETIRLAAVQCHRNGYTRFENLENMLGKWRQMGLLRHDAAGEYVGRMSEKKDRVRALLELAGSGKQPRMSDIDLLEGWQARFDGALIEFAASCARRSQDPMPYMDRLLREWEVSGATTVEAARAQREAFQARPAAGPANPALDYAQRDYRPEDFGEDFFINLNGGGDRT